MAITRHANQRIGWIMVSLLAAASLGCSHWIDVTPPPSDVTSPTRLVIKEERVPLLVEGLHVIQNGAPQPPSANLERQLLTSIQETRLFSTVVPLGSDSSSLGEKIVTARLTMEEIIDPRPGTSTWKGFVVGASMFLLAPIIELDYGYRAQATLEIERWDGEIRHYHADSSGTARYHLFGATPFLFDELKGQVTEACLQGLMHQLVRDSERYLASNPSAAPATRTITVGIRPLPTRPNPDVAIPTTTKLPD
ncbi:MAG: hypothetical protein NNA23_05280 [Nitrospira sp.]|nr:hypothetical protein [Nitrospira sp.]MCP9463518.1 hypothetical protein [Nitrospira sp.]